MPGAGAGVVVADANGVDTAKVDSSRRLHVDAEVSAIQVAAGSGAVQGSRMRYERLASNQALPASTGTFVDVFTITEKSVFYKALVAVNSDHILLQVNIDGVDILPSAGIELELLEDFGMGKHGSGYGGHFHGCPFDLIQCGKNVWLFVPCDPLLVDTLLKLRMKASDSHTSRMLNEGLAVRRSLA